MMFTEVLAAKIVEGEKTATRRAVSTNPRSPWFYDRGTFHRRCRYPTGATFAVNPGRGVPRVCDAEVTRRFVNPLGNILPRQAREEGFATRDDFIEAWKKINGSWDPYLKVHVVEFKLVGSDCMGCDGCGWCEGSPAFTCTDCGGTGVERSPEARALLERVAKVPA